MNPFDLPVHPIVVHFPIAMLAAAWVCTLVASVTGRPEWGERTRLFELIGVATLPVTIIAGFIDTRGLGPIAERRWDQPLIWHVIVSLVFSAVFAGHFFWRRRQPEVPAYRSAAIDVVWVTLGFWGFVLTGAIAGEMVYAA